MTLQSVLAHTVRVTALAGVVILTGAWGGGRTPYAVKQAISVVQSQPVFGAATWGLYVADLATGETLINQGGATSLVPASTMKIFSVATALESYGPDYRFHTPVYRVGEVANGVLTGDLVLVASGDFSFGLREQADGTLAYNSLPDVDHNSTYTGFPGGALIKNSNPLAALDALAAQVKAAGVKEITGDVLIDDRLFETFRGFPAGTVAPIWINENVIDITVTPGTTGEPAHVEWRPHSAAITVENDVVTAAGTAVPLSVRTVGPGVVRISGGIAADSPPVLTIANIDEPAVFARAVFIEALARAGITVAARPLAPAGALPDASVYADATKLAEYVSLPLSEYAKVIFKVSYNHGADLMVCLAAVKAGSRDCSDGLIEELHLLARYGIVNTYPFDGAGTNGNNRTTAADAANFLRGIVNTPWGAAARDGMAVLGVDGSQAQNGVGTPAAGRVRIKDGDLIAGAANGQLIALAMTQAGFIDAKSGRQLVYGVFVNNAAPFSSPQEFLAARAKVAAIVVAIQQGY